MTHDGGKRAKLSATWSYAKSHAVAAVAGAWLYAQLDRCMELLARLTSI